MRRHIFGSVLAVLLAAIPGTAAARQVIEQSIQISPGPGGVLVPGMGGPREFKTGTGRIRGRVLAGDAGAPIRRAQVRISGQDIAPKAALTDAEGRFEFRDLPAGRFTLQATKSGFVSVQYGQTRPFESGKPIELLDKQSLDDADLHMPRGGVISGRVVDEFGDAIPDVAVTALRPTWVNGRRRLAPTQGRIAQTNDLGQFRIYGLPPGEYYVSAGLRGGPLDMMDLELMVGGASTPAGPTASTPRSGYAATYYPGTPNVSEAQRISLGPGQEVSSADFALTPVRLARVSGIVLNSEGRPLEGAAISVVPASRDFIAPMGPGTTRSGKDGAFTLNSVPPGDYLLQARSLQVITRTQGDNVMMFRATAMAGSDHETGTMPIAVGGEDVSNVVLATTKGGSAVGQLVFDGPKPASITGIVVSNFAMDFDSSSFGGVASVKEDGTFEIKGVSGTRIVRVGSLPPGWTLKSVKLNGTDITDTGVEFKPGETTSGLEIELSPKSTTINGGVTSADGSVLKDYTVVIFSDSPEHWRHPNTRWVSGTRPDQEGRFRIQHLPPGTYLAVAVDYLPTGEWGDPEILDRLKVRGHRFTLGEGATETLSLKLTREY